ncbi:META domain-containing protein [Xanthomarina sp. GH4-25]|uniref:META domain-containing protein n=1 Tax=Xanthomarina sp. GH4-25 TaxID=3349335 RepID=UPI000D681FDD|nr:hypothetical protein DI383_04200 [Flavobacteriaceae bacterium LYZ1037]
MKYLTILLSLFTFMSCGNSKDAKAMENSNQIMAQIPGTYQVTSIEKNDASSNNLTLQFDNITKTVSGFSGCNRFTGNYKLDGNSITLGPLASTRMACKGSENTIEQKMLQALSQVNVIRFENQELILSNNDLELLKATKYFEDKIAIENNYVIEYTAQTRGFYNHYIFENGSLSIQKDRTTFPVIKTCSQEDINILIREVEAIDLEKLKTLKAPTEKRFVDAAAIAVLKVTYQGETYQTPEFDNGEPNTYISSLVTSLLGLAEKQ